MTGSVSQAAKASVSFTYLDPGIRAIPPAAIGAGVGTGREAAILGERPHLAPQPGLHETQVALQAGRGGGNLGPRICRRASVWRILVLGHDAGGPPGTQAC